MKINIASNEVIHFIGIGGSGMSGLAQIMNNLGFAVQASDLSQNKNIDINFGDGAAILFVFEKLAIGQIHLIHGNASGLQN